MASTAAVALQPDTNSPESDVSLTRLYVLRATYLLLAVGVASLVMPSLMNPAPMARGVIPSLLGGVGLCALIGLKYPVQMLPLLMFEFVWKTIWLLAYGVPQWSVGQTPMTYSEDFRNIAFGVILMPIVMPWSYVYRHYIRKPAARWR